MPTNRTKRTRTRAGALDHWKVDDLMTGGCYLSAGYTPTNAKGGCGHWTEAEWAEVHEQMRADWKIHGADLMAWWRGEHDRYTNQYNTREKYIEFGVSYPFAAGKFGEAE